MTAKDARELVVAEYLRPIPARSDYLDTAVNPAPWLVPATTRGAGTRTTLAASPAVVAADQ
jgi:hypothetical protein